MTTRAIPTPSIRARETPDIETGSDSYARRFAGAAGRYLLEQQESAVGAVLAEWRGGTVLDVGGGHAQLTPMLLERASAVVVLGSDESSLEQVRRSHPSCATAIGDLLSLPFPAQSFDVVVSVRLLPHVQNWPRLVAELCRVARHSIVVDYPRAVGFNALTPMLFSLKRRLEGNTRQYRNFCDSELDDVIRACGFEPRVRRAQLVLPMVVHRRLHGAAPLRALEWIARPLHLTAMLGSPVVLRADRRGE
jgi:SAM-dependent methyltransferase